MKDAVRCPYCVSGFEFHIMFAHVDGRYMCNNVATRPIPTMQNTHVTAQIAVSWSLLAP
jgi:hypothetical protein